MEPQNQQSANLAKDKKFQHEEKNLGTGRAVLEQTAIQDRESDQEKNEDYCFKCKKRGDIFCCDNCPRSFHAEGGCLPRWPTETIWRCPCCRLRDQCPVCEVAVQPVDRHFICNMCYRRTHNMCTGVPKELLAGEVEDESLFMQEPLFICYLCLYNSEIKLVVKSLKNSNSGDFKLVNPYFSSAIHLGWISEGNLNKILEKPKRLKHSIQGDKVYKRPQIDRLLSIHSPLVHQRKSIYEIIDLIRDPKKKTDFGDPNNFRFLVKWKGEDYLNCTWQDEVAVKASKCKSLQNFLSRKEFEMQCLIEKTATIRDFRPTPQRPTLNQYEDTLVKQMVNMYLADKNILLSKFAGQKNYQALVATALSILFYDELLTEPFLVLARYRQLQSWVNIFDEYCPGMYLVNMTGLLQNRNVIKTRQLFYEQASMTKFDILLTTYDCFSKDIGMFYNNQINVTWAGIIYDDEIKCHLLLQNKPNVKTTHKILLIKQLGQAEMKNAIKILSPSRSSSQLSSPELDKETLFEFIPKNCVHFTQFKFDLNQRKPLAIKFTVKQNHSVINNRKPSVEAASQQVSSLRPVSQTQKQLDRQISKPSVEDQQKSSGQPLPLKTKTVSASQNSPHLDTIKYLQSTLTKEITLQKLQRITFLRFVIAYGIEFSNSQILLNLLVQFDKGIFENTEEQRQRLQSYVVYFLAVINSNIPEHCVNVLFNLNPSAVMRRITDLHNLRKTYDKYRQNPKSFPIKNRFDIMLEMNLECRIPVEEEWSEVDDLLLFKLILDYGYDNWQQICESTEWVPTSYRRTNVNPLDFLLRKICNLPTAGPLDKLKQILNDIQILLQTDQLESNINALAYAPSVDGECALISLQFTVIARSDLNTY